ncbi:hypothetical protein SAMN05443665_100452 [Actinomadura meyerae]|uniref:Uncharacterized protein n=1 Tax=Actinomadura meyerae TaxID=240840 RepID=A0A239EH44_9ACTN|nr:hypothetical protein [Actinomadura meyerae]SNS43957.1 hypothetical protein SAMN05443665_100452 [Actinomadura meyerae]
MRRAWTIGAVAALVAGLAAAPARADESPWRTADAPWGLWPESGLNQVAALGPGDVWAAGFEGLACIDWSIPGFGAGSVCSSNAVVRHWNGSRWENRNPPGAWNLEIGDVDASSPGNVWIAGRNGNGGYVARWDGSRWTQITLPEACRRAEYLQLEAVDDGVWATNGCIARWKDGAWTTYDSTIGFVHQTFAVSDTELWAGGSRLGPYRPIVVRWDGKEWVDADVPEGYTTLLVAGPGHVWVQGPGKSELMHRTAAGWTAAPKPPSAYLPYRLGEDGSLWTGTDPSKPGAVFYRFDGAQWQTIPMPARTGTGSRERGGFDYTAVPGTGTGMIGAGTAPGGGPLIMTNRPAS